METIQLGLACRKLRTMALAVTERTGHTVPASMVPDTLAIVGDALVAGRCELDHLHQLRRVRDELLAAAKAYSTTHETDAWHTRLWAELVECAEDLLVTMVGAEFQLSETARTCGDPMLHITFLACGLAVPDEHIEAWHTAVDEGHDPLEALEAVGQ